MTTSDTQQHEQQVVSSVSYSNYCLNVKLLANIEQFRVNFMKHLESEKSLDQVDKENLGELSKSLLDAAGQPVSNVTKTLGFRLLARHLRLTDDELYLDTDSHDSEQSSDDLADKSIEEATNNLWEYLKFYHQFNLIDTTPETFPKEFYLLSGIFSFGFDKNNVPLVWISSRVHRKWSSRFDHLFKRYVAWHIDCMTNSIHEKNRQANLANFPNLGTNRDQQQDCFGLVFDCCDVGISSVDTEFLKLITSLLLTYYPNRCKFGLIKDLPWILRSVWSLVKSWLPESSTKSTHLITGKELLNYIDFDQFPNTIKEQNSIKQLVKEADSESPKHREGARIRLPTNFESLKDIEGVAKELSLSPNEVIKFKSHVNKIVDEYEKIGAL